MSVEGCRANQSLGRVTAEREGGREVHAGGREEKEEEGEVVMHCSRGMEEPDEEEEEEVDALSWRPCFLRDVFIPSRNPHVLANRSRISQRSCVLCYRRRMRCFLFFKSSLVAVYLQKKKKKKKKGRF